MRVIKKKYSFNNIHLIANNKQYIIPISLISSYQNVGLQSDLIKDWVNGECYSNQIWTQYNNEIYELKDTVATCGQFDDCLKEINFNHDEWNKINFGKTKCLIGNDSSHEILAESRLAEFQLLYSTDNMGNTLHGIIDGDYTDYEPIEGQEAKIMNYPYKQNTIVNASSTDISYVVNGEKNYKIFANILSDIIENDDIVTFIYNIGAILYLNENNEYVIENQLQTNSENIITASPIVYTEQYQITIESELFFKNKDSWFEIKYKKLTPLNTKTYQVSSSNSKVTIPMARIRYDDYASYNNTVHNLGIVLDENVHISLPHNLTKEVGIVRGTSNYYERHLILGNVKNFEALQQYSNGYFKIIDNNNL